MTIITDNELLDMTVSFYSYMKSASSIQKTIREILFSIRSDTYKRQICLIRDLMGKDDESAKDVKSQLPAVTFSGSFGNQRIKGDCNKYNKLLVLDIDKIIDKDRLGKVKYMLSNDPYIISLWTSPSGNGLKGLVAFNFINDKQNIDFDTKHKAGFIQFESYLYDKYDVELDKSGKDITRLCFMSWSPDLLIKQQASKFDVNLDKVSIMTGTDTQQIETSPKVSMSTGNIEWNKIDGLKRDLPNKQHDRSMIERIYRYLKGHHTSITEDYSSWVKVAFSVANTFHSVYGRKIFMKLCELDGAKHDSIKSERLIYDAYRENDGKCEMATIIYLAKQKGFKL